MFCQLEVLRHCFPPSVRHILEELPDSLDETYERILREIRKPNQEHALRLMHCLVAAVRPLQLEELAEVLAFDFNAEGIPKLNPDWRWEDKEEAVMSSCSSLVMIVKDGDSRVVQFSHFSVKEFLTANRLVEPIKDVSRYHIRREAAHTILAQACLGVLLRMGDRMNAYNIKDFPLARYAGDYWPAHARVENVSSHIKDGMECLFDEDKPHFATWLWISKKEYQRGRGYIPMITPFPKKPEAVPLYRAAMHGFRDLAEHLIAEHPEHVHARGGAEMYPIHVAARRGHADILSLLLDHGADVDGRNDNSQTPLHRASYFGEVDAGQILLDRGADIHARDWWEKTPLFTAAEELEVEFVQMLLKHGARINDRDHLKNTPLHLAVERGSIRPACQTVRLLLEHGADVNARNYAGWTPSDRTSNQEILELMSEYSAKSVT